MQFFLHKHTLLFCWRIFKNLRMFISKQSEGEKKNARAKDNKLIGNKKEKLKNIGHAM